jgi:UDP-N-acetylglucosamine 1-carboxyvinyltransferase
MEKFFIEGGCKIQGQVRAAGAKNAVLPILAASLLAENTVEVANIPHLNDVTTMVTLLSQLGARVLLGDDMHLHIDPSALTSTTATYDLVKTMRASILVLGPLLTRFGSAKVAFPGGCAIGTRPVDLHIQALEKLGAKIEIEEGYLHATVPSGRLQGAEITFPKITVTGTENVMMAAVLAKGVTTIKNAAAEPEVYDLAVFLNTLGAKVSGQGTSTITIEGVEKLGLQEAFHSVMPDRIEVGTYLVAACMTRGSVRVNAAGPAHMRSVLDVIRQTGAEVTCGQDWVEVDMHGKRPKAISIETDPYPGMPTDMQAQFMALNTIAEGEGSVIETVFENRFMHVPELCRMGAKLELADSNCVHSVGIPNLIAAPVMATDLRASAGLVLAALVAEGQTCIDRVYHIDRGYECIDEKLQALGVPISRVNVCPPAAHVPTSSLRGGVTGADAPAQ